MVPRLAASEFQRHMVEFQFAPVPRGAISNVETIGCSPGTAPSAVKIRVMAVGINFRDILNILGAYPGDPGMPGSDCAGVVLHPPRLNGKSEVFCYGERVMGLAIGCLGNVAWTPQALLCSMPEHLRFSEACTAPTVFVTVDLAFNGASNLSSKGLAFAHLVECVSHSAISRDDHHHSTDSFKFLYQRLPVPLMKVAGIRAHLA